MKITTIPQVYRNVNRWGEILTILSKYGLADGLSRFDLSFARGFLKAPDGEAGWRPSGFFRRSKESILITPSSKECAMLQR